MIFFLWFLGSFRTRYGVHYNFLIRRVDKRDKDPKPVKKTIVTPSTKSPLRDKFSPFCNINDIKNRS